MFNFFKNQKQNTLDVNNLTSVSFESFLQRLSNVPESNWYQGRREPVLELFEKYEQIHPECIKPLRHEIDNNKFLTIVKIDIGSDTYIYFDEWTMIGSRPTINWFQLEKQDKSLGLNMYKTKLLLSSDNNAKTQGSIMFLFFE